MFEWINECVIVRIHEWWDEWMNGQYSINSMHMWWTSQSTLKPKKHMKKSFLATFCPLMPLVWANQGCNPLLLAFLHQMTVSEQMIWHFIVIKKKTIKNTMILSIFYSFEPFGDPMWGPWGAFWPNLCVSPPKHRISM